MADTGIVPTGAVHEGFLVYRGFRYLKLASLLCVLAVVAYWWHSPVDGPDGGTWLGQHDRIRCAERHGVYQRCRNRARALGFSRILHLGRCHGVAAAASSRSICAALSVASA